MFCILCLGLLYSLPQVFQIRITIPFHFMAVLFKRKQILLETVTIIV